MEFTITIETSSNVANRMDVINGISTRLARFFVNRYYGADLAGIVIGVICVEPEFDWFSTVRKPKYTHYKVRKRSNNEEFVEDRLFTYYFKLEHAKFKNQDDGDNLKLLARSLLSSLECLDQLPKKVRDFDKERFKSDLFTFLANENLATDK